MTDRNFGIKPLQEGDTLAFEDGKRYRISINADGSPRFVAAAELPTTPGVYTIYAKGANAIYVRLVLDQQRTWHILDLSIGHIVEHRDTNAQTLASQAAERGTLNLVHATDDGKADS